MKGGYRSSGNADANLIMSQAPEPRRWRIRRVIIVVGILSLVVAIASCLFLAQPYCAKNKMENTRGESYAMGMDGKNPNKWVEDCGKEFYYGVKYAALWPISTTSRMAELFNGSKAVDRLDFVSRVRYVFFPYNISSYFIFRFIGVILTLSGAGYLLCWIGLTSRFGWSSYIGLLYFIYLLIIAILIISLEATK